MKLYHHIHKIWLLTLLEKHGFYKLAAAESQLTHSALTQNIANLEKILGSPLTLKGPGKIKLTAFGERLVQKARPIIDQIDNLSQDGDEEEGIVKIGVYDSLEKTFLSKIIVSLSNAFPSARFEIETARSAEILNSVKAGALDFGFLIDEGIEEALIEKTKLADIKLGLYISKEAAPTSIQTALANYPLLTLLYPNNNSPEYMSSFLKGLPIMTQDKCPERISFSSFDSIMSALSNEKSIGVLPNIIASKSPQLKCIWEAEKNSIGSHSAAIVSRHMVRTKIKNKLTGLLQKQINSALSDN